MVTSSFHVFLQGEEVESLMSIDSREADHDLLSKSRIVYYMLTLTGE